MLKARQFEPNALPVRPIRRVILKVERVTRLFVTFDDDDNPFAMILKKLDYVQNTPPFITGGGVNLQKQRPDQKSCP